MTLKLWFGLVWLSWKEYPVAVQPLPDLWLPFRAVWPRVAGMTPVLPPPETTCVPEGQVAVALWSPGEMTNA